MNDFTPQDLLRLEALKKQATTDILGFRAAARAAYAACPRKLRRLAGRATTKDSTAYTLFQEWAEKLAPQLNTLQKTQEHMTFRNALAKHLQLSEHRAAIRAGHLIDERRAELHDEFLILHYDASGRARRAAEKLIEQAPETVRSQRDRYVTYLLFADITSELGITVSDSHAPLWQRLRRRSADRRQTKRYKKQQLKRLGAILKQQQTLAQADSALIERIQLLELDTVLVLASYRKYKKQLDALKPEKRTPAKTLALFTSATKAIRDAYASKLTETGKLRDLQDALKELDEVLVELFDMTDRQRNTLMAKLKEYRELDREKTAITKERAKYSY